MSHNIIVSLPRPADGQIPEPPQDRLSPYSISLEPMTPSADAKRAWVRSHPDARKYIPNWPEKHTEEDSKQFREERDSDGKSFTFDILVTSPTTGDKLFAGTAGVFQIDMKNVNAHAGVFLSPEFWGQGLATIALYLLFQFCFEQAVSKEQNEKAEKPLLHRLTINTAEHNVRMRSWLEKTAGIQLEGIIREAVKYHGTDDKFADTATYGLLSTEWEQQVKKRLASKIGIGI